MTEFFFKDIKDYPVRSIIYITKSENNFLREEGDIIKE